jgi:hypothetical protein
MPFKEESPRVLFTAPPEHLIPDLQHSINNALTTLPPDKKGALVLVGSKDGDQVKFNAAVVADVGKGWKVESWIGKTWGQSVEGGAIVMKTW